MIAENSSSTTVYQLPLVITRSIPNFYSTDPLSTLLSIEMSTVSPQATSSKSYLSDLKAYELNDGLTTPLTAAASTGTDYFTTTTTKVMITSAEDLASYASTITSANEIKLMDHSKIIRHLSSIDPSTSSSTPSPSPSSSTTEATTQQQMAAPNRRTLTNPMPKNVDSLLEDECDAFSQNKCEPRSLHITCG